MKTNKNRGFAPVAIVLIIIAILAVGGFAYYVGKSSKTPPTNTENNNSQVNSVTTTTTTTAPSPTANTIGWKTFVQTKYGFSFQYPSAWSQRGNESEAVCDIHTGATCVDMVDFMDTASQGIELYDGNNNQIAAAKDQLHVEYHFDSKGTTLYQYDLSQYQSKQGVYANSREIVVAGNTAIVGETVVTTDAQGKALLIPLHEIVVNFLDKNKIGMFDFVFYTPEADAAAEVPNFEQLLSTFKFN